MDRMKITVVVLIILFSINIGYGYCDEDVIGVIHGHSTHSDGINPEEVLLRYAGKLGLKFYISTEHFPCVVGYCNDSNHYLMHGLRDLVFLGLYGTKDISDVFFQNLQINKELSILPFVSSMMIFHRGAEIYSNQKGAHILLLGIDGQIIQDKQIKRMGYNNNGTGPSASYIIKTGHDKKLLVVWAHPHDNVHQSFIDVMNQFDAIEFFNTKGYNIVHTVKDNLTIIDLVKNFRKGEYKKAEKIDLDLYCQSIKNHIADNNKKLVAVTGGCDIHVLLPELCFGHTSVRLKDASDLSIRNILNAIKQGKSCALMTGIKGYAVEINELNYYPRFKPPYEVKRGIVHLKGKFTIPRLAMEMTDEICIYRDGEKIWEKKIDAVFYKKNQVFNLDFKDHPDDGRHVYFIYIPHRFITSPIVFDVKDNT
ncbi:MAG: hypothetical protein ACTSRA_20355, partial [Promethearchaeota archaeon]